MYLTIPEITESEELFSVSPGPDGLTFTTVMGLGNTAMRLQRASSDGEHLPLVVLVVDPQTLALDSVYVTGVEMSQGEGNPVAQVTFLAREVRIV
jgi:hypothetical protein